MPYQGPGLYTHYKGGFYRIFGLGQHESTGAMFVIYMSLDIHHERTRSSKGVDFVLRPLDENDGPDAFNTPVDVGFGPYADRFEKMV